MTTGPVRERTAPRADGDELVSLDAQAQAQPTMEEPEVLPVGGF